MLKRIFSLIKKEFITIWKDPKSRAMIIAMPIMQLCIFAHAITMEIKNIDTVVLDRDRTQISRELVSRFEGSERFRKIIYAENEMDLKKQIELQKVQLGIEIPSDFSRNIKSNKAANVYVISDGRQTNTAGIATAYAGSIISGFSPEFTVQKSPPINFVIRNWYNENLEYKWYIMQIIITMLSLVITLLLTALSIAREKETGTFDQLIVSPLSSFEILVGKTIPPLCIAIMLTSIMTFIVTQFFGVPFRGSLLLFFVAIFTSLLALVGVGLFISSVSKTQQQAILGVMTFQMPAVLLSGFISPIADMPKFFQYITWLNPIRFFIETTRGIFFKNMGVGEVFLNLIPLMVIATVTLTVATLTFKKNLD